MAAFVDKQAVFVDQDFTSREQVLDFISNQAVKLGDAQDAHSVRQAFTIREDLGATGLQDGFAIPHAKSAAVDKPSVIVVKLKQAVEWPSFDGKPVDTVIALLVPEGSVGATHIKLLSKLAVLLMRENFRNAVRACNNPTEIARIVNEGLDNA